MATLIANIGAPRRGPGTQQTLQLPVSSSSFTWSWGIQPAQGAMVFVASDALEVIHGAWLELTFPGKTFYGIIQNGVFKDTDGKVIPAVRSSRGQSTQLDFVDTRLYLAYDMVMCAFNQRWTEVVNGQRARKYWHIYPNDALDHRKTWTDRPLSATQILQAIFASRWVETKWTVAVHPDMNVMPIYDLDAMRGRLLSDVLSEIGQRLGMVLTVGNGPFDLIWARKGEGAIPPFPDNTDDKNLGYRLSGAPTKVDVIGDRNRYLLLNVNLEPDWNRNWERFWPGEDALAQDLFLNDPAYNSIAGDVEQIQGRQLAGARAKEITVREYAAIRKARDGADFTDFGKFQGRMRMDMPAALYIRLLVGRAWTPPTSFPVGNRNVDLRSWTLVDDLPAGVNYDPTTGQMTAHFSGVDPDTFAHAGGNGFAVVKGYLIGSEIFKTVRPDRFNLDQFTQGRSLWRAITLQTDDRGDGYRYVLLDDAVVDSTDFIKIQDGFAVLNAAPNFKVPQVMACLCFEGERFFYAQGLALGKDEPVTESGLRAEYVASGGRVTEIPYSDGKTAAQKAAEIASVMLQQFWALTTGGFSLKMRDTDLVPSLTGAIDRITVEYGPGGRTVRVDLATERAPRVKVLERDYDRSVQMAQLLPGTRELRGDANLMRGAAAAFRSDPALQQELVNALHGRLGGRADLQPVIMDPGAGTPAALKVGTPVWKPATTFLNEGIIHSLDTGSGSPTAQPTKTRAVLPTACGADTPHFLGVTVRDGEDPAAPLRVQTSGDALARVMGPIAPEDTVCRADGQDYLVKADKDSIGVVGRAMQSIEGTQVKLIWVQLGVGGSGGGGGGEFLAVFA